MNYVQRMCTSKRKFDNKGQADFFLELKQMRGTASKDHTSYKCPLCPKWHIGAWHFSETGGTSKIYQLIQEGKIDEIRKGK